MYLHSTQFWSMHTIIQNMENIVYQATGLIYYIFNIKHFYNNRFYLRFQQSVNTTTMIGTARRHSIKMVATTPMATSLVHVVVNTGSFWGTNNGNHYISHECYPAYQGLVLIILLNNICSMLLTHGLTNNIHADSYVYWGSVGYLTTKLSHYWAGIISPVETHNTGPSVNIKVLSVTFCPN